MWNLTTSNADALPVAIVNEPFAQAHFGGANPIGRRIRVLPSVARDPDRYPWLEIVGVVPDVGLNPGNPGNADGVYRPMRDVNIMRLAVRGNGDPGRWTPGLLEIVRDVDPNIQVQWSKTLEAQIREPVAIFRALGAGFLLFGVLALLLSGASLHPLTAASVTRRTHELGVRQALGARRGVIVSSVVRRTAVQVVIGGVLGAALAAGLMTLGSSFPWEVSRGDARALILVAAVLLGSMLVALAGPLRPTLSISPADALRNE